MATDPTGVKVMDEQHTEILIVGGSLGGVAAALAALGMGKQVILTEENHWIGGQLTSQGVPPDENPWIDRDNTGCTASYRYLRDCIRDHYRRYYPLLAEVAAETHLNPGMGNVSPLCHESHVAHRVIQSLLAPYLVNKRLKLITRCRPIHAETDADRVIAVTVETIDTGDRMILTAPFILDATELGDLLELANIEHITGAESQSQTGEPHALPDKPDPLEQQAFSWCFYFDLLPNEDFTIPRPTNYDFWREYQAEFWPARQLSWTTSDPVTLAPSNRFLIDGDTDTPNGTDWWHFRRVLYRKHYADGLYPSDVVAVNWPQMDYWLKPLVGPGIGETERRNALDEAHSLSESLIYWMQTEAPRHDGKVGYPGLRPRGDLLGSSDYLAQAPYIRESRRIQAEFTVLEQHVGVEARDGQVGAEVFDDSVGIGSYRIDLHPTYRRNYIDITNYPVQIPLGALLPVRVENLLPACKNIGVTHITNGCYRLHPIEWNIGEAAGMLAAHCLNHDLRPRQVRNHPQWLYDFQKVLSQAGIVLEWPEAIRLTPA